MDIIFKHQDWVLRIAKPEDNAGICKLFRDVNMDSDLVISEEREPDFFRLRQLHSGVPFTVVLEDTDVSLSEVDRIAGCCTAVIRDGWVDGEIKKIAYICDLRVNDKFRRGRVFPQGIDIFTQYLMEKEKIDAFYFSMMRSNMSAQHARVLANARLMTAYNMVNIQVLRKSMSVKYSLEKGSAENLSELATFLSNRAEKRFFGFHLNEVMLKDRIDSWPGFTLEDFFILRNDAGEIVASAAPWDIEPSLRKSRVHGYEGSMKYLRKGIDLEAKLRGHLPMPTPGECFHILSLTHFEVEDDNPIYLNQLLRGIYNHYCQEDYHFIAAFIPEGSGLEKGFKGFRTQKVPMDLYAFTRRPSTMSAGDCVSQNPGFEMALH